MATNRLGLPDLAFIGKAGAGKTLAAELLAELGYHTCSFSTALKDCAAMLWGDKARSDRSKLQPLGTEIARQIDEDVWVNLLLKRIQREPALLCVCDDCRFPNEYYALKGEGFVIVRLKTPRATRIDRLKANGKWQDEEQLEHSSETAIDDLPAHYTINNDGPTNELYDSIIDVVIRERRRR